jgi:hypothetical protein
MTPEQIAYADGVKGLIVAGAFLFVWVLGRLLVPRLFGGFAGSRHARTLSLGWLWLTAAWFFNALSLWCVGTGRFGLVWVSWGLGAFCRLALVSVVLWRLLKAPAPEKAAE